MACSLSQYVSAEAVRGFQSDDVLIANIGDGAADVSLAVGALAEFAGDIRGKARTRWFGHHAQRGHNLVIGKHIEVRRLLQRNTERLLHGVIENRIARGVGEVAQHKGVFLGELLR